MYCLVIAEHDQTQLKPSTLHTIAAAKEIANEIDIIIIGHQCQHFAEDLSQIEGIKQVLIADATVYQHALAENVAALIVDIAKQYTHVLASSSTFGKNLMPRVAALLDVGQVSDITKVESADTFVRPIYAGNAFAKVQSQDNIKIITVRTTGFEAAKKSTNKAPISAINKVIEAKKTEFIGQELTQSERPELTSARVVISGGRALQSAENFKLLEALADRLNAAIGASRAAVDAGFVPNDCQVGQTGKVVAPELYIAVGISGAIQHIAGIKDSKVIVAINKDPDAPIFQIADYGLVGDLFEIIPELTQTI